MTELGLISSADLPRANRAELRQLCQQAVPGLVVMRPGVDFVTHFDQQGDVGAGPETGIQAKDGGYGRRIARILVFEALQAFLQRSFLRLQQGKCILLALDLFGKLRHDLRLAGLLMLSRSTCCRACAS